MYLCATARNSEERSSSVASLTLCSKPITRALLQNLKIQLRKNYLEPRKYNRLNHTGYIKSIESIVAHLGTPQFCWKGISPVVKVILLLLFIQLWKKKKRIIFHLLCPKIITICWNNNFLTYNFFPLNSSSGLGLVFFCVLFIIHGLKV